MVQWHHVYPPHSGYHWNGSDHRFFEGWYYRVTLPDCGQTFAFMYSIEDPIGGKPYSGGAAQILGPTDHYFCQTFPNPHRFWSWGAPWGMGPLGLGHWGQTGLQQPPGYLPPRQFDQVISAGYQGTLTLHQGHLMDPGTGESVHWSYQTQPIYGWGDIGQWQQATAGGLSFFAYF